VTKAEQRLVMPDVEREAVRRPPTQDAWAREKPLGCERGRSGEVCCPRVTRPVAASQRAPAP